MARRKNMERALELQLYRLQAELCQVLADPTRLEILSLLETGPRVVKELVEATGQRQAKISQHLAVLRQRGIVQTEHAGTEVRYSLADPRILDACHITREVLLQQLTRQATLATHLRGVQLAPSASDQQGQ
jgi:ArsR family transcriptional regulator, virulence genes transcriptional regulator